MVLHNPNNWHWVNKDIAAWARQYLEQELLGLKAEENGVTAQVDKILSMDGDVDVSQRKGKVITLFDVKLQLEWSGTTEDETASGTITVPEVAHDTEEDEYVFDIDIYSESSSKQPVKDLVRKSITPQLRTQLAKLAPAIIETHAKDLQHAAADAQGGAKPTTTTNSGSTGGGVNKSSTNNTNAAKATPPNGKATGPKINTTTVTDTEEFRTSAEELYNTFTDPQRIAAFTRSPPKPFEAAKEGTAFELFGGNVSGTVKELKPPTRIVQSWRLQQWPAGHFSTLAIDFDQNDVDAVTVMRVEWSGVPVGQEEVTKRNWREYYVRSIKTTFGFGTIL